MRFVFCVAGALLLVAGAALAYPPAGLLMAGGLMLAAGVLVSDEEQT